jgi:hypothetical protein
MVDLGHRLWLGSIRFHWPNLLKTVVLSSTTRCREGANAGRHSSLEMVSWRQELSR